MAILVLATVAAVVRYIIQVRSAQPTLEDLMPGSDAARSRQVAILIGPFGESLVELWRYVQRPEVEAALTVAGAAIVAAACFGLATLFERSPEPIETPGHVTPEGDSIRRR